MRAIAMIRVCAGVLTMGLLLSSGGADFAQDKPKKPTSDLRVDGKTLNQWEREIGDRDPSTRQVAMLAVIQFGSAGRQAAHELINELSDRDPGLRAHAAY